MVAPHFIPLRIMRLVAVMALVSYLAGSLAAVFAKDADLFKRFGSLGVAAAILFFTDRLQQNEQRRQRTIERLLHEFGLEMEVLKEGISAKDLPQKGYLVDYLEEERRLERLRLDTGRIMSLNIILLTAATLQWGFGDVFFERELPLLGGKPALVNGGQ